MEDKQSKSPLKRKKIFYRIGLVSLLITFTIGVTGSFALAKEVTVKVNGMEMTVRGRVFQNVQEILESNGIVLDDGAAGNIKAETKIVGVSAASVNEKNTGNLYVDGETIPYETNVSTVAELLAQINIKPGDLDRVEPAQTTALAEISEITITRVEIEVESIRKEILFATETKNNPKLGSGDRNVLQPGKNGVSYITKHIRYENNVEVERETISEEIVTAPISEIVEVAEDQPKVKTPAVVKTPAIGETQTVEKLSAVVETPTSEETPKAEEIPTVEKIATVVETPLASETATVEAPLGAVKKILNFTAYTATGNATASGVMPKANHTIAAWNGLPFGTKVYVPSLGTTFTVEDRGGAVTDGIIDIYMNSYNQCIQFGRQDLEAYISY